MTTTVSAPRMMACGSLRATSSAFARASRLTCAHGVSPGSGVSSTAAGMTVQATPAASSKALRLR